MTPDQILRDKLRKIEALFAGAATPDEKAAAGAAAERIRERLGQAADKENFIEWKFSIPDIWSRQLFGGIRSGQDRSRRGMARFGQGRSAFAKPFAQPMIIVTALSPECFDVDQWSLRRKIGADLSRRLWRLRHNTGRPNANLRPKACV